jgi:hypothetical protein
MICLDRFVRFFIQFSCYFPPDLFFNNRFDHLQRDLLEMCFRVEHTTFSEHLDVSSQQVVRVISFANLTVALVGLLRIEVWR